LAHSEEGEFELVLGNRQLISVFLIVVILLGVFFSMGYIVGRNSAPVLSSDAGRNGTGKAIVVERPAGASQPAATADNPPPDKPPASSETSAAKPETTHPAQPAPPPVKETKPSPAPAPAAAASEGAPPPGDYWQVVATSRPDADIVSGALTKKGFHALVVPVPNDTRFRVLVGPLKDAATQSQTRTDLEAAGFRSPIMRKY
jgi:cell division septation protein DedD